MSLRFSPVHEGTFCHLLAYKWTSLLLLANSCGPTLVVCHCGRALWAQTQHDYCGIINPRFYSVAHLICTKTWTRLNQATVWWESQWSRSKRVLHGELDQESGHTIGPVPPDVKG